MIKRDHVILQSNHAQKFREINSLVTSSENRWFNEKIVGLSVKNRDRVLVLIIYIFHTMKLNHCNLFFMKYFPNSTCNTVWKIRKFTLIEKILREINSSVISLVKTLFFCQKSVRLNFRNFHLTCKNCEKLISRKIQVSEKSHRVTNDWQVFKIKVVTHSVEYQKFSFNLKRFVN